MTEFAISPELLAELHSRGQSQPRPGKRLQKVILPAAFVQLPYAEGLEVAAWRDASAAVPTELAYLAFKMHRNTVPLTDAAARIGRRKSRRQGARTAPFGDSWDGRGGLEGRGKNPHVTLLWI